MSEETAKPDGRRWIRVRPLWITFSLLLLLLYVLSCGPVMDALNHTPPGSLPRRIFVVVYWPLMHIIAFGPRWIADPLWRLASLLSFS